MNINLEEILKTYTDRSRYNSGHYIYKNGVILNNYAKQNGSKCIFYGTVLDEQRRRDYTSMISINTKTREISNVSCDCFTESQSIKSNNLCSHIVAIVLKGIEDLNNDKEYESKEGAKLNPNITFNILSSKDGYMNARLEIDGISEGEYKNIYNAYKENNKLYRLKSGNYLDLSEKNLKESLELIDTLGMYENLTSMKIDNNKSLYLKKYIEDNDSSIIKGSHHIDNIVENFKKVENLKIDQPNINAKLREYQIEGYEFLKTLSRYEFGGILADEMGLGKTIQTIAFLQSNENKKAIVLTPTSLIYNWLEEFKRFSPNLKIGLAYKSKRDDVINYIDSYDVILTTYTTYKNDTEKYKNIKFDYCIIDEAQNIKNPDSIIAKSVKKINAKVKFALTGTPIENNLIELWSIFDFVMPGYLYDKSKFKKIFLDKGNTDDLKKLIKPFLLRRTKKEVINELPEKIEQKYYVELNKEHKKAYLGLLNLAKNKIQINDNISVLSYLTKLRQLAIAPELMVKNYEIKNSKLEVLVKLLKENKDKKILVFSQFTKVLEKIKDRLDYENISYSYLDGKTNPKDRVNLVKDFNKNNDNVFLISLKAGGTGLNLTSASIVIHFDPWFNPAVENQASDRAHRIGQKNVVNVIKLISKDTVEEKIIRLQEMKKELVKELIDSNTDSGNFLSKMSVDDIIDIMFD